MTLEPGRTRGFVNMLRGQSQRFSVRFLGRSEHSSRRLGGHTAGAQAWDLSLPCGGSLHTCTSLTLRLPSVRWGQQPRPQKADSLDAVRPRPALGRLAPGRGHSSGGPLVPHKPRPAGSGRKEHRCPGASGAPRRPSHRAGQTRGPPGPAKRRAPDGAGAPVARWGALPAAVMMGLLAAEVSG